MYTFLLSITELSFPVAICLYTARASGFCTFILKKSSVLQKKVSKKSTCVVILCTCEKTQGKKYKSIYFTIHLKTKCTTVLVQLYFI